ncbi:3-oxoacyl-[acyl-carrier-protein] synthase III C-terminal domain-containing protein [Streptomyces shenzhenensis]|uniref:3-oxoacyl-[acyl-carrier-protein] synthase III C-terminal domain-containing protein n=1 Tax=Streptomyces shenzhenensis TaxID=943815 RepID=UPI002867C2E4|nr:3-oxoacyl-[acyl-carrier-protein] synthase III C-terminal domain-containing protein [Streptomyces shenzhenensis]
MLDVFGITDPKARCVFLNSSIERRLSRHDVRHTTGVLRDYGNVSSGSFLFSYERLLNEQVTTRGDYGVLMTMGPGSTLETALVQW